MYIFFQKEEVAPLRPPPAIQPNFIPISDFRKIVIPPSLSLSLFSSHSEQVLRKICLKGELKNRLKAGLEEIFQNKSRYFLLLKLPFLYAEETFYRRLIHVSRTSEKHEVMDGAREIGRVLLLLIHSLPALFLCSATGL